MAERVGGFPAAARRLCRILSGPEAGELSHSEFMLLVTELKKVIWHVKPGRFQPADVDDFSSESLARFSAACRRGGVGCDRAERYLSEICRNVVFDALRRVRPAAEQDDELPDQAALEAFGRVEGRGDLLRALEAMREDGHLTCVRIVVAYLDLADAEGGTPSLRRVGEAADVSAPTVRECLVRFGTYLTDGAPGT
ncbi:MAG: hypothetical protein ACJ752_04570 [Gaiellaceae bacterium]